MKVLNTFAIRQEFPFSLCDFSFHFILLIRSPLHFTILFLPSPSTPISFSAAVLLLSNLRFSYFYLKVKATFPNFCDMSFQYQRAPFYQKLPRGPEWSIPHQNRCFSNPALLVLLYPLLLLLILLLIFLLLFSSFFRFLNSFSATQTRKRTRTTRGRFLPSKLALISDHLFVMCRSISRTESQIRISRALGYYHSIVRLPPRGGFFAHSS